MVVPKVEARTRAWAILHELAEFIGYGEIEKVQIVDGIPVRLIMSYGSVKLDSREDIDRIKRARR